MFYEKVAQDERHNERNSRYSPALAALCEYRTIEKAATAPEVPVLRLPRTSESRLAESHTALKSGNEATVLYLAYGSNLAASTFLGMRGIKPLSVINVLVPSLALTFDLPGLPYGEPCFANTKRRDPSRTSLASKGHPEKSSSPLFSGPKPLDWAKPMIGVVYEVTPQDYAHIIATEGGGASYQDILVPCHAFSESYDSASPVPNIPETPAFTAHTLFAPYEPPVEPGISHLPWSKPIFRPSPTYAQPSLRYLTLIRTGAREHDMPAEYIAYIDSLHNYTITSTRQKVGAAMFLGFWGPIIRAIIVDGALNGDDEPRAPWLITLLRITFWAMWLSYDWGFRAIAGDGERTIGD